MIEIEITGGFPAAKNNLGPILEEIGEHMFQSIKMNFSVQGRPLWPATKSGRKPLLVSGALEASGQYKVAGTEVVISWGKGLPYAWIQNFGGSTHPKVTAKSKKFFWYKYLDTGEEYWKFMALKPIGEVLNIDIPARTFMMFQDKDIEWIYNKVGQDMVVIEGASSAYAPSKLSTSEFL